MEIQRSPDDRALIGWFRICKFHLYVFPSITQRFTLILQLSKGLIRVRPFLILSVILAQLMGQAIEIMKILRLESTELQILIKAWIGMGRFIALIVGVKDSIKCAGTVPEAETLHCYPNIFIYYTEINQTCIC
jgi:hypothetical protein